MLDRLKSHGWALTALALAVLVGIQTLRLHSEEKQYLQLQTTTAQAETRRLGADLKNEQRAGAAERQHAASTQENSDAFTTTQPARDAAVRADRDRFERLFVDADRRAATYRAMATANTAACIDLADRHAALDRHVVQGVEVVAGLRKDLARRDAEVALLRRQIDTDRALLAQ